VTRDKDHIYKGPYTYTSDIILTTDNKHVYKGAYTYTSNILFTWDAPIPTAILMTILL